MTIFGQELVDAIAALGKRYPYWRFGQLIENISLWARGHQPDPAAFA